MKKIIFPVIAFLFVLAACGPSITVSSDYDKTADFASYKTFNFTDDVDKLQISSLNLTRAKDAITAELAKKGVTKATSNPDLLVDIKVRARMEQSATATTTGSPYYGAGYRYGWGGGFSTTSVNVENYTVGTVFIDLIDAKKSQLVWQGRGEKTIDENASAEKREKRIQEGMARIFEKYPPKK